MRIMLSAAIRFIIIIIVSRPFFTQKRGLDDTNKLKRKVSMLYLILAKNTQKPNALPVPLQWSILVFSRPHRGLFLRDIVLLFVSLGELTISQNHHHEGTKEQIERPPEVSSLKSLVGPSPILIAFYDLQ